MVVCEGGAMAGEREGEARASAVAAGWEAGRGVRLVEAELRLEDPDAVALLGALVELDVVLAEALGGHLQRLPRAAHREAALREAAVRHVLGDDVERVEAEALKAAHVQPRERGLLSDLLRQPGDRVDDEPARELLRTEEGVDLRGRGSEG